MSGSVRTTLALFLVVACSCCGATEWYRAHRREGFPARRETEIEQITHKAMRGLVNVVTGWGEIPRQMVRTGRSDGALFILPLGIPRGLIMSVIRTGTGLLELAFPFDAVTHDYEPLLIPTYVWQRLPEPAPEAEPADSKAEQTQPE